VIWALNKEEEGDGQVIGVLVEGLTKGTRRERMFDGEKYKPRQVNHVLQQRRRAPTTGAKGHFPERSAKKGKTRIYNESGKLKGTTKGKDFPGDQRWKSCWG